MIKNVDRVDDIEDITALHSRGCAYVVMKTRAAAFKTLQKLASKRGREEKRKVDWAINSGLKDAEMAAYFDKAEGAAFIEYSKLPDDIEVRSLYSIEFIPGLGNFSRKNRLLDRIFYS